MTKTQQLISENFAHLSPKLDFLLAPITYMKIGGPAEVYLEIAAKNDAIALIKFCHQNAISLTILGGASNVIIPDEGIHGVIFSLENRDYEVLPEKLEDGRQIIRVGAGIKTAFLVRKTLDSGLKGLEYFLGVPGSLGGAIYNNAHYMSDLIGKHVYRVQVITPNGETQWMTQAECDFAYDHSIFQQQQNVIIEVEFALFPGEKDASLQLIKEATQYRATTQPLGEPSSGCYFRNTQNTQDLKRFFSQFAQRAEVPSGFLIDQAGLKGTKVGGVEVSDKHAAFLINKGTGTSKDVRQLAELIKQRVKAEFGVELREEVFFLESK